MSRGLRLPSGRVIAVGRLMLATLFLLAVWLDVSQPVRATLATYVLLATYVAFSLYLVLRTWRDWWLDAKFAGPAHAADIMLFTVLVYSTAGYESPFFTFFMFLLLSAASRWGWRATALTAVLVTLLYLLAGLIVATSTAQFELQRLVLRTGHLVILSLILIWFGINQWRLGIPFRGDEIISEPSLDESPVERGLRAAMKALHARAGVFVWRGHDWAIVVCRGDELTVTLSREPALTEPVARPLLYDLAQDRALTRDERQNLRALYPRALILPEVAASLGLEQGLLVPVRTGTGEGELFLEGIRDLSTDHIELGEKVAADIAAHIQRHALLRATEENAEARSRLALARDLHDSVVQFLAGAAFRLEAMKRSQLTGDSIQGELNELKQLMLLEQGELRSFISALRSSSQIALADLARELRALADRLSRQWGVDCDFTSQTPDMMVPSRLHLDAQHLTREAVANAVRHAGARSVTIRLDAATDALKLDFINNGSRYPDREANGDELPKSLRERVALAGGEIGLTRGMGVTRVSVSLPIVGRPD